MLQRGRMQCNVGVRIVNATTLEVTRGRRKVERCDVLARIKHMKMQGSLSLVEITPRAKLEIAQGRYMGLGMFTAATGSLGFSKISTCRGLNAA